MTTAEKLIKIAENNGKIFQAGLAAVDQTQAYAQGYEAGKAGYLKTLESLAYFCIENANWDTLPWLLSQDLSHIVRTQAMFIYATNLTEFQRPETMNPRIMRDMFSNATKLTRVSGLEGLTVENRIYSGMFNNCTALTDVGTVNFTGISAVTSNMFKNCTALVEIRGVGQLSVPLSFAESAALSNESVQSVLDCLQDLTGTATKTLTFHSAVGAKLTTAQKAAATAKNWTLVY